MLPVTGGEPDGPGPALVLPNAATSPDGATGAAVAVTNELAHAAAAASLQLSQDPMLLQRPSLGAAFLVGMLQAMADKGLMGIESVTLLHEDGEGAEVTATTASRGGGGSGGALPGAASLDAAMRMARLQTATSCTCVVHVSLPTMFSHGPYTPASSDVGSPGMILMLSASERPAWSPASEHRPLQGGGNHVPSELLSELLPFHIVVDSDGRIMQVYVGINGGYGVVSYASSPYSAYCTGYWSFLTPPRVHGCNLPESILLLAHWSILPPPPRVHAGRLSAVPARIPRSLDAGMPCFRYLQGKSNDKRVSTHLALILIERRTLKC